MAKRKLSHPKETQKSDQQQQQDKPREHDIEALAVDVASVLHNPACPPALFEIITDGLVELQNFKDRLAPVFLVGLFKAPKRERGAQ